MMFSLFFVIEIEITLYSRCICFIYVKLCHGKEQPKRMLSNIFWWLVMDEYSIWFGLIKFGIAVIRLYRSFSIVLTTVWIVHFFLWHSSSPTFAVETTSYLNHLQIFNVNVTIQYNSNISVSKIHFIFIPSHFC